MGELFVRTNEFSSLGNNCIYTRLCFFLNTIIRPCPPSMEDHPFLDFLVRTHSSRGLQLSHLCTF
ncbi:uncharacterized protein DS421_8g230770 [Arachis hypogaea]|nr:uncharacterized protein DS421_8g230770 [Arachis hypogaea]